jgi:hypothetical protein
MERGRRHDPVSSPSSPHGHGQEVCVASAEANITEYTGYFSGPRGDVDHKQAPENLKGHKEVHRPADNMMPQSLAPHTIPLVAIGAGEENKNSPSVCPAAINQSW